jgi:myosin-crossreactive antigen
MAIGSIDLGIGTLNEIFTIKNIALFGIVFIGAFITIQIVNWIMSYIQRRRNEKKEK